MCSLYFCCSTIFTPPVNTTSICSVLSHLYAAVFAGVSQGEATLVQARQGGSVELSCNLGPISKETTTPKLFPLHVVEWVRLGFNIPILIKFGVYTPRVHPNYKGKSFVDAFNYFSLQQGPCDHVDQTVSELIQELVL